MFCCRICYLQEIQMSFSRRRFQNPYYKPLLKLGLPIILGQVGLILVGFIDNMMVGHYGTPELASASFVNNFMNLAFIFGLGFSYGLSPLIATSVTGKDGEHLSLLKSSLLANLIIALFLVLVMGFLLLRIDLLNQPEELIPLIVPYYIIQLASIPVLMLFNGYKQYAEGAGNPSAPMVIMLLSNGLNIVLNYLLIYGKLGFPELGLTGAGLATFIARLFCLVALGVVCYKGRSFVKLYESLPKERGQVKRVHVKSLFGLGISTAAQMGMETASFSLAVVMVGWMGANALAAHQIMSVISTLGFMIFYGLSAAVTILMSKYYGEGLVSEMRRVVQGGRNMLIFLALVTVVVLLLTRNYIGYLFTDSIDIVSTVSLLIFPVIVYQFGDLTQILYANALRGIRDVKYMAVCALFCHIFLALSLVYVLGIKLELGVLGVWMAFPVSLSALGLLLHRRFRKLTQDVYS